jgi:hypothetical protein
MKIVFTKNNMPLSWLIRCVTREDCSHMAIVFDDLFVVQSNLFGVGMETSKQFFKVQKTVHTYELPLLLSKEDDVWKDLIKLVGGAQYDFKAVILDGVAVTLKRFFGIELNPKRWHADNKYLCYELAFVIQEKLGIDLGLKKLERKVITPLIVYKMLRGEI